MAELEAFNFDVRKAASIFSGDLSGFIKGGRHEFAGHKPYSPGDDFRYIDWNAASRSDSLHSKTYFAESSSKVHIWIDASTSMFAKLNESFKLAISLAFLAMKTDAEVSLSFFTGKKDQQFLGSYKNQASIFEIISILNTLEFNEYEGVKIAKDRIQKNFGRNSQIILISDGYEDSLRQVMKSFTQRNMLVLFLQALSASEISPAYFENMLLTDSETHAELKIMGNHSMRDSYTHELENFISENQAFCRESRIVHRLCNINQSIKSVLINDILNS